MLATAVTAEPVTFFFASEYTLDNCSDRVIPFWPVSTKKFKKTNQNLASAAILVCTVNCIAGESGKFTVEGQQYKAKLLRINKHLPNSSIENWQNIQDYAGPNDFKAKAKKSECGVSAAASRLAFTQSSSVLPTPCDGSHSLGTS